MKEMRKNKVESNLQPLGYQVRALPLKPWLKVGHCWFLTILAISLIPDFSSKATRRNQSWGEEDERRLEFIKRMDSLSDNENI